MSLPWHLLDDGAVVPIVQQVREAVLRTEDLLLPAVREAAAGDNGSTILLGRRLGLDGRVAGPGGSVVWPGGGGGGDLRGIAVVWLRRQVSTRTSTTPADDGFHAQMIVKSSLCPSFSGSTCLFRAPPRRPRRRQRAVSNKTHAAQHGRRLCADTAGRLRVSTSALACTRQRAWWLL